MISIGKAGPAVAAAITTTSRYYGTSSGCLLGLDAIAGADSSIEGPTHALQWSPAADVFVSITGDMPKTRVQLCDARGAVLVDLGMEVRARVARVEHGDVRRRACGACARGYMQTCEMKNARAHPQCV